MTDMQTQHRAVTSDGQRQSEVTTTSQTIADPMIGVGVLAMVIDALVATVIVKVVVMVAARSATTGV